MNRDRLRALPFIVAMLFVLLAVSRPHSRAVWLALAGVWIVIGIRLRRREPQ
jgi:hypothetical protein